MKLLPYICPHSAASTTHHPLAILCLLKMRTRQMDADASTSVSWQTSLFCRSRCSAHIHFEIFRAKRLFGVWAFYYSALIRLLMENSIACPSVIHFPLPAFKLRHNRYNYSCKRLLLHTCHFTTWCICCSCLRVIYCDNIMTQRDDSLLISSSIESHILATWLPPSCSSAPVLTACTWQDL